MYERFSASLVGSGSPCVTSSRICVYLMFNVQRRALFCTTTFQRLTRGKTFGKLLKLHRRHELRAWHFSGKFLSLVVLQDPT